MNYDYYTDGNSNIIIIIIMTIKPLHSITIPLLKKNYHSTVVLHNNNAGSGQLASCMYILKSAISLSVCNEIKS